MAKGSGNLEALALDLAEKFGQQLQTGLSQVLQKVATASLLPLAGALDVFAAATGKHMQLIQSFVAKADPATALAFNRALDDLAGTLGQILTPILQASTIFIREFADVMQGLRPAFEPIMTSIGLIVVELSKLIEPLMSLFVPVLQLIATVIKEVVVPAIRILADTFMAMVQMLRDLGLLDEIKKASSVGAAVRAASYGSIEDIGKRTTLAALQTGMASADPQNQMLAEQRRTNEFLGAIKGLIEWYKDKRDQVNNAVDRTASNLSAASWGASLYQELFR